MVIIVSGTVVNNLLDGQYAKDYYNVAESTIGVHLVNPTNGRRLDNNQIWGSVTKQGTQTYNLEYHTYWYPLWKEGNTCPYSGGKRTSCGTFSIGQSWGCLSSEWRCDRVNKNFIEWH
ncbi:hypothetical protein [Arcobacter sp. F2176]|uniref:hypothetical protein n=1 Tax=Arcobacter sp. F2176 TaxID=2044511 RepID=UPI00100C1443|nr:hypothetical protein [Arcobacter sp. F2176]